MAVDRQRKHLRTPAPPGAAAADHGAVPALRDTLGSNDCSVWLYSCGEAFGYGSQARGDWDGFSDTDLLVVAANKDAAERGADQLWKS